MEFICNEEHSCLLTAVQLYFKKKLFSSYGEFLSVQRPIARKITHKAIGEHDTDLLLQIQIDKHQYCKKTIFYSGKIFKGTWPPEINTLNGRAILEYGIIGGEGHTEAVEFTGVDFVVIRTGEKNILPHSELSLEEFLSKALNIKDGYFMNVFIYKRIY
jgi:hypothetical protein